ncbi:MAG TPA: STAS domain-containing protein, partial [Candidatus Limnocylindrales bacterium]|nr:STAS domain-containing protein [Candidatus Limnocylindrales bacterium]
PRGPDMAKSRPSIAGLLRDDPKKILTEWVADLRASSMDSRIDIGMIEAQATEFLQLMGKAGQESLDPSTAPWQDTRAFLEGISKSRAAQGLSSMETATFVFSLKRALFARLQAAAGTDAETLARETWVITELIDKLGLHTVNAFQKAREAVIARQQEELLELSTPVVKLWDGVLALPMIGTLDSSRTQVVMESLLQRIVETGAEIAIIDITGVPTVDTLVAQHLLKTVTALRLMGADCIICGIRPQIAQTIVHLGIELQGITTKATLADALALALKRSGLVVTKAPHA